MSELQAILSIVTGSLSLLGVIYLGGYWKGRVDQKIQCLDKYPLSELAMMVKTLYDVYVIDVLHQRPDLIQHNSPYKTTPVGESLIPTEVRKKLSNNFHDPDSPKAWQVIKEVGLDTIQEMAQEKDLTIQQTIALLAFYQNGD